jgi:hypothetical protein
MRDRGPGEGLFFCPATSSQAIDTGVMLKERQPVN